MPTLNWIGKDAVIRHHKEVPFRLLEADAGLSHGKDTGNLIVQGDNLHALKALLPKYAGKVKCIYIDPPYNTGNEGWVYNDKVNSPEINRWLGSVVGKEAEDLSRHDKWLCMMYPRMVLLKQFLAEDGAIFVSIDDNEVASLRLLMDEIFGRGNFVEVITWNKRIPKNDAEIGNIHEHVVIFRRARTDELKFTMLKDGLGQVKERLMELKLAQVPIPEAEKVIQRLYRDLNLDRGMTLYNRLNSEYRLWGKINMSWPNGETFGSRYDVFHPLSGKPVPVPDRGWRWKEETLKQRMAGVREELHDGSIIVGDVWFDSKPTVQPSSVKFLEEVETILLRSVLSLKSDGGIEVENIFGSKSAFSYPKPTRLIQLLINSITKDDDIILDSFAGSGTTGHAVLKQNAEDGGTRKFILVEMEGKIARDITAERVRRVAGGYTNAKGEAVEGLGGGFQFCTLSGEPLFNEFGDIRDDVRFAQLADFVWFAETGEGYTGKADSPLLGVKGGTAVYLLFNGILGDRRPEGGNILTQAVLDALPPHDGPKVIYAAAVKGLGPAALQRAGIVFKQTPYAIEV